MLSDWLLLFTGEVRFDVVRISQIYLCKKGKKNNENIIEKLNIRNEIFVFTEKKNSLNFVLFSFKEMKIARNSNYFFSVKEIYVQRNLDTAKQKRILGSSLI